MAEKKPSSKKPDPKVAVSKKTIKDLKIKTGKANAVKGGVPRM